MAEIEKGWCLSPDGKSLTTQYGTAIIHADGTITYTANPGISIWAPENRTKKPSGYRPRTSSELFRIPVK